MIRSIWRKAPQQGLMALASAAMATMATMAFVAPASGQVQIDADPPASVGAPEGWSFSLGLGAAAVPDYEGSEDYKGAPLPIARVQKGYQYGLLFGTRISSNLIPHPNWRAGPLIEFVPKRSNVDNNKVDRLKTVDAALMLGAQVGYDLRLNSGVLGFEVDWTHDTIDGNGGWIARPRIKYRRKFGEKWGLNIASTLTYASDDYMETYFTIDQNDSTRSGLSTFSADEGIKDVGANVALTYSFNDNWSLGSILGYKRLLNDAEDSPVTKVGSENQFLGGVFVTYSWQAGS
jgi:outer membrane protein